MGQSRVSTRVEKSECNAERLGVLGGMELVETIGILCGASVQTDAEVRAA